MQKITPFLWFDNNAQEAIQFYTSVFKNSRTGISSNQTDDTPGPTGEFMVGKFYLNGQEFMALNGGPTFHFTEAISLVVNCEDQEEVDYFWDKLISGGGAPSQCGWLKDKFGLSWQIVPTALGELMASKDKSASQRAMAALMKMTKIDIKQLEDAAKGI